MKFSTREDIAAPIAFVFDRMSNFEHFERQALRRGAHVRRSDHGQYAVGSAWDVRFKYRGKERSLQANLARFDDPQLIQVDSLTSGIEGVTLIELVPLSPARTRIAVSIDLRAKTLSSRLLLQSLKLAKSNLTGRFKKRIADYAQSIEDQHSGPRL